MMGSNQPQDSNTGRPSAPRILRGLGPRMLLAVAGALLRGGQRSLAADAARVVALLDPPPRVEGLALVPAHAPFVLVANHFQAPGFWVGWVACAIASAVAAARAPETRELHWVVTSEWRWFVAGGRWVPNPATTLLFPRAALTWQMVATPARPSDRAGRARALRQMLRYLGHRRNKDAAAGEPVGLFPEGKATMALEEARPGTGAFLSRVSSLGIPLLPAGAHQDKGRLVLRFGAPFLLAKPPAGEDADDWARRQVMVAIGRLLPEHLWGVYARAVRGTQ